MESHLNSEKKLDRSLSVLIPCLNEELRVRDTVIETIEIVEKYFTNYEILLINDGSTDCTSSIMEDLAAIYPQIRVHHNTTNIGLGASYRVGASLARCDYIANISGDGGMLKESWPILLSEVGKADIITSYVTNLWEVKPLFRFFLSKLYTLLLSIISGFPLKYFNGPTIYRTELLQKVQISSTGFGYQSEILFKLLRAGYSYVQVGIKGRSEKNSNALRFKNIISVGTTLCQLILGRVRAGLF